MNFDFESFARAWKLEVRDKSQQIDPSDEYVWRGVAMGWAIGKGMSLEQSQEFVNHLDVLNLL